MTTPDPAVSVSPVDTDGLRAQIAEVLTTCHMHPEWPNARHDEHTRDGACYLCRGDVEQLADALVPVFEQAHGDLARQARMWQRRAEVSARDAVDATSRAMVESGQQRARIRELEAELASRSTPPQDAGLPEDAAEQVAKRMLRIKLYGVGLSTRYDWNAHRQWVNQLTDEERAAWLRDARALLADLGLSAPATDPVPATPDGPHRVNFVVAEWDERIAFATCRDCLARISGDRPDVWEWKRLHEGAEDARCTKVNGDGARCIKGRALPHWCVFDETEPVAPQAPAEPPVGDALCGQVHDGLTCVHPRQAGQNGCWGHYGPEEDPQAHYRCDARWHIAGQNPCPRCEPIPGRPLPAVPAVPEDTATPAARLHDPLRVEMADRLHAVWELATAATRDGRGLTGDQAARIEHLADIRHPLDAGDLA